MAELADAPDLGSGGFGRAGSIPVRRTRNKKEQTNMAIYIKPIPTLTGAVAEKFEKIARENEAKRGTVDFTKQREAFEKIMENSRIFKMEHGIS